MLTGTGKAARRAPHVAPCEMEGRQMTLEKTKMSGDVSRSSTSNARGRSA